MAYSEYAIASYNDAVSRINDFCTPLGFVLNSTSDSVLIRVGTGPMAFNLKANTNNAILDITSSGSGIVDVASRVDSPIIGDATGQGITLQPTKMFAMSGDEQGQPYVNFTIEYGFNTVRHIYIGNMVKAGNYNGGQVFDVTGFIRLRTSNFTPTQVFGNSSRNYLRPLFTSCCEVRAMADNLRGGVSVGADGVDAFPRFLSVTPSTNDTPISFLRKLAAKNAIFGGYGDALNDFYVNAGLSPAEGSATLVPINLYVPVAVGTSAKVHPIGHPAGIRMVNLAASEPYNNFLVGSTEWRSFPAAALRSSSQVQGSISGGGTQSYVKEESSYYLGYAFKVD